MMLHARIFYKLKSFIIKLTIFTMPPEAFHSYDVSRESWYSPEKIIIEYEKLSTQFGQNIMMPEFKRAREMAVAAITLLGAYELSEENKYWMQSNNQSTSPDVMAAKQRESENGVILELAELEIVDFEKHSNETDIVDFLLKTKLSNKSDYDEHTLIVVMIGKNFQLDKKTVQEKLKKINPKPVIYFVGKPGNSPRGNFSIFTAFPPILKNAVVFNAQETLKKYSIPGRVDLFRSMQKKISFWDTEVKPVDAYEIFHLDRKKIHKKYLS